jgi:catechol 2,3-dioxygenase-like lactoylglutathione lyase family enzyme
MIECIDHVNIVVQHLPAMTTFYRDVLGMRVVREVAIGGDWIAAVTGLEGVEADVVYFESGSGAGLELIHYRSPKGARPEGLDRANTKGIRHLAFRVDDLDAQVAGLKAAQADLLSAIQEVPTTQVEFAAKRKRIVYCRDPEGNLIELCAYV